MDALLDNLFQIGSGLWGIVKLLVSSALPWLGIVAWVAYWLFAANWVKLRKVLLDGGWIGVVLIGLVMILVWGSIAPPESGHHYLFGLSISNFVGKTVYVTALFCMMLLCGSVQLSGVLGSWAHFPEPELEADDHGHHNAHSAHGHAEPHAAHH